MRIHRTLSALAGAGFLIASAGAALAQEATHFTRIDLEVTHADVDAQTTSRRVNGNNRTVIFRPSSGSPVLGTASTGQMIELSKLVHDAKLVSIPQIIQSNKQGARFVLNVDGREVKGVVTDLRQYEARLKPLIERLLALGDGLMAEGLPTHGPVAIPHAEKKTVTGTVREKAGKVTVAASHGIAPFELAVTNTEWADLLKKYAIGHYVTLTGKITGHEIEVESANGYIIEDANLTDGKDQISMHVAKGRPVKAVLGAKDGKLEVELADGKKGWLPADAVQVGGLAHPIEAPAGGDTPGLMGSVPH